MKMDRYLTRSLKNKRFEYRFLKGKISVTFFMAFEIWPNLFKESSSL